MSAIQEAEVSNLPQIRRKHASFAKAGSKPSVDTKRLLDIFGASVALILCAPVLLMVFLSLSVFGNPIFSQRRVGRDGKLFSCYKFRTMVNNAERVLEDYLRDNPAAQEEWLRNFKLAHDPRITPMGGFLRKSSLDELPQLFNVLRGDMSLVGPRPIVPAEVPRYAGRIQAYQKVRPGLTGLWQVSGRNLVSYRRRVALDTFYARERSIALDVVILVKTVGVVIGGKGAS